MYCSKVPITAQNYGAKSQKQSNELPKILHESWNLLLGGGEACVGDLPEFLIFSAVQ